MCFTPWEPVRNEATDRLCLYRFVVVTSQILKENE